MKLPKVTVYITNYNYGNYLKQAIQSVLNQSFQNYELLIIDDGSTDNSKEILEQFESNEQINIIYQKNKGLIYSNNIALRASLGEYIIRLDADDYFDKNALLLMVAELDKDHEVGLVFPNYFIVDNLGNILSLRQRIDPEINMVLDIPAHGACTMIRKQFLLDIGGYDESFTCQDGYYLWINFITKHKVRNIETPLFYYRQHGLNLTADSEKILKTRSKILESNIQLENIGEFKTLAIVPVRGKAFNMNSIALDPLSEYKTVLDAKLDELLKCSLVTDIIVTSSDPEVLNYVNTHYTDSVRGIERPHAFARLNSGLVETIDYLLSNFVDSNYYDAFLTVSIQFPLLKSYYIDNSIKALHFFSTDSVMTVRPDHSRFFKKSEKGLEPILNQEGFTKLERDDLYKYSGGIIVTRMKYYIEKRNFFGGMNGHVIIDEEASLDYSSELYKQIIKSKFVD